MLSLPSSSNGSIICKILKKGELPETLWITSSDNFASWGGGGSEYHKDDLNELIKAVDYISMHTYPMHDTHYNPDFWGVREEENPIQTLKRSIRPCSGQGIMPFLNTKV
jgi:hypothetical protein